MNTTTTACDKVIFAAGKGEKVGRGSMYVSSAESAEIVKELWTQRGLRFSKANSKKP